MKGTIGAIFLLIVTMADVSGQALEDQYMNEWKKFYPSKAVRAGIRPAIFSYEDRSSQAIQQWIDFNVKVLELVSKKSPETEISPIDGRLLRVQAQSEIDQWQVLKVQENDLGLYMRLLANTLPPVLEQTYLTNSEKGGLVCKRLTSILQLANAASQNLKQVAQQDHDNSQRIFDELLKTLDGLKAQIKSNACDGFEARLQSAKTVIKELSDHVSKTLSNSISDRSDILGKTEYARRLSLYTDSDLIPERLADMALEEIQLVRQLMDEVASRYLQKAYRQSPLPETFEGRLEKALEDMEQDIPLNSRDYEQFWQELTDKAIKFVEEKGLGTLPENQTLSIRSAPESAGPAARIGWVGAAPPFDPNPWTTLYLPSIPDTLPAQEQVDFWSSFNKPFNRIIVIHELFPGHYMQLKISRETPHPHRLLFPYGPYVEGWATFCERVALDEGWDAGNDMTMLAHLRKRIENANRAYTSVMVHTEGWTQEQVMKFSTGTALVAPQFAKSLWYRLMRSPMQLTSYFYGGAQFSELMKSEKERLGDQFDLTLFMDTIMRTGPIPIDEFEGIFAEYQ
ncbi:MAG: DUF885 family protein [Cytophagales bacterium]|nr:DUF885 family protein [Cytophagales bacterium]